MSDITEKYIRSHPINIIEHTSKYLILLIFPLVRALVMGNEGLYAWLQGAWFDILTVMAIVGMGFWAWFKYVYRLSDNGIHIKKGIFLAKKRFISFKKLSVVVIERPFYLMPFKAARVHADTDGGAPTSSDFAVTMYKHQAEAFVKQANRPFINKSEVKRVYLPKGIYIAVLSLIASNTLTGVIFAATFISGSGKVLGVEFESRLMEQITTIMQFLAFGLPPVAAVIGGVILGGWLLSFLINLERHLLFCVTRQGGSLFISSGAFTKREFHITIRRINMIEVRQSLITKVLGLYTVMIHANGYGKRKDELSVLMPAGERHDIHKSLEMLLPEIPVCPVSLRPRIKYLSRFMIPPVSCIGVISVLFYFSYKIFYDLTQVVVFFGVMALIPAVWYLFVKIISYFHTGLGESEDTYTFRYTYGYRIKTVAVPKKRVVKLTIRRSLFQVMSGCCDLVILTFSEGVKRHVVPNLNFEDAKKILKAEDFYKKPSKKL